MEDGKSGQISGSWGKNGRNKALQKLSSTWCVARQPRTALLFPGACCGCTLESHESIEDGPGHSGLIGVGAAGAPGVVEVANDSTMWQCLFRYPINTSVSSSATAGPVLRFHWTCSFAFQPCLYHPIHVFHGLNSIGSFSFPSPWPSSGVGNSVTQHRHMQQRSWLLWLLFHLLWAAQWPSRRSHI